MADSFLLQEEASFLLLEDGFKIILDEAPVGGVTISTLSLLGVG